MSLSESSAKFLKYTRTFIKETFQGNSYNYQNLSAKIKSKLGQGLKIQKISLLRSPLTYTLTGQQILQNFKRIMEQPLEYLKHPLDSYMKLIRYLHTNSMELMLAGLAAVNHILRQSEDSFTFDHHQILIQFSGEVFLLISFCHNQFQFLTSIDDAQLVGRRPDNTVLKVYQQEFNFDSRKILQFVQAKEALPYHLLFWNCQNYCQSLLKHLGLE